MTKPEDFVVAEDVPTDILASAIVKLSAASQRLLDGGLSRQALLVLLKHATGLHMGQIGKVLDALPKLASMYTTKATTKAKRC